MGRQGTPRRKLIDQREPATVVSPFPSSPMVSSHPRNARERLAVRGNVFSPHSTTQQISAESNNLMLSGQYSEQQQQSHWAIKKVPTWVMIVIIIAGFLWGFQAWMRPPNVLNSPSSNYGLSVPTLHSQLVALEDEVKLTNKAHDAQVQKFTKTTEQIVSRLSMMFDELNAKITRINGEIASKAAATPKLDIQISELANDLRGLKKSLQYDAVESKVKSVEAAFYQFKAELDNQLGKTISTIVKSQLQNISGVASVQTNENEEMSWAHGSLGSLIDYKFTSKGHNKDLFNKIGAKLANWGAVNVLRTKPMSEDAKVVLGGGDIQQRFSAGNCFAFSGQRGNITVILPSVIDPSGVRIDHVSAVQSPNTRSAPKTVAVYVDDCVHDEFEVLHNETSVSDVSNPTGGKRHSCWSNEVLQEAPSALFGEFVFDYPKVNSQIYARDASSFLEPGRKIATRRIRFAFLDNHGSESYTCVYRLRVFGKELSRPSSKSSDSIYEEL